MSEPLTKAAAMKACGFTSDEQLANAIGITRQAVHGWAPTKKLKLSYRLALHARFPKKIKKPE